MSYSPPEPGHLVEPVLPAGAADYLSDRNPRLNDLRARYRRFDTDATRHSRWTREYIAREVPLTAFRGECAYVWQRRDNNLPLSYVLTYHYLLSRPLDRQILEAVDEDGLFGAYTLHVDGQCISRDRLDSVLEIAFLHEQTPVGGKSDVRVLDIGSGYGRLAHRLCQVHRGATVRCVDGIPESAFLCEYYLRFRGVSDRAQVLLLDEIESDRDIACADVAVNVHSFSECTRAAIAWWLGLIDRMRIPWLMIVPNPRHDCGRSLSSTERDGTYRDFSDLVAAHGYARVVTEPKYKTAALQECGVTPTHYHLFRNRDL